MDLIVSLLLTISSLSAGEARQLSCPGMAYCDYLSEDMRTAMEDALNEGTGWVQNAQCDSLRTHLLAHLWAGQWGRHTTTWNVHGKHYPQQHTGGSSFHYSFNQDYPFFDTVTWGLQTSRIQVGGLMLHEHMHHLNPGYSESQIDPLVAQCVPAYDGDAG